MHFQLISYAGFSQIGSHHLLLKLRVSLTGGTVALITYCIEHNLMIRHSHDANIEHCLMKSCHLFIKVQLPKSDVQSLFPVNSFLS